MNAMGMMTLMKIWKTVSPAATTNEIPPMYVSPLYLPGYHVPAMTPSLMKLKAMPSSTRLTQPRRRRIIASRMSKSARP